MHNFVFFKTVISVVSYDNVICHIYSKKLACFYQPACCLYVCSARLRIPTRVIVCKYHGKCISAHRCLKYFAGLYRRRIDIAFGNFLKLYYFSLTAQKYDEKYFALKMPHIFHTTIRCLLSISYYISSVFRPFRYSFSQLY